MSMATHQLAPNFHRLEFRCRGATCCSNSAPIALDLVYYLQQFRDHLTALRGVDTPLFVSSGFRCITYNTQREWTPHSQHTLGLAADITRPAPMNINDFHRALLDWHANPFRGIGLYDWGLHLDIRAEPPAHWDQRSGDPSNANH